MISFEQIIGIYFFLACAILGLRIVIKEYRSVFKLSKTPKLPDTFPCNGCGCCCNRVDIAIAANSKFNDKTDPLYFPYNYNKTGRCEKLTTNNHCSVYAYRPLVCNVDKLMEYQGSDKKEYYNLSITACNLMMDQDLVPNNLRIKPYENNQSIPR